jgi:LuxR family transcriptional regulator, maltose regulon positive regulatory protein
MLARTMSATTISHAGPADPWARRPSPSYGVVGRPHLVAALAAAGPGCVAALAAPAGYGKTTLLCEWEASDRRPFTWVDLDARDDDPARLHARVTRALAKVPAAQPFVLVLDDAQALRGERARRCLAQFAADLPRAATLALAARSEPPLALARLRAEHRLVELGPARLSMTREEIVALLALADRRLSARDLDALVHLTKGWPAGLSLALLALEDGAAPSDLSGDEPLFADYVADEILGVMSSDERAFLRRASVLDTLSGPACDAVLERSGCAAMLARLARANVPLVALDRHGETYRLHRLLAATLAAELTRVEPVAAPGLHRRAAAWLRRADDADGAVRHALAGGDPRRAAALVWTSAAAAVTHGEGAAVERHLERFTARQMAAMPELALTAASVHLMAGRGDLAAHWAAAAAASVSNATVPGVGGAVAAMRAALGHGGLGHVIEDAARAVALMPDGGPCEALCRLAAGAAHHLAGDRDRAACELEAGARCAAVTAPLLHALCLAQLGVLALERDDRDEATELLARARAQVKRHGLADVPACALVFAVAALVRAHAGSVEDARRDLDHATRLQGALVDFAPWYAAELRILSARAAWRLCDVAVARTRLREATRYARRVPEATALAAWIDETHEQLAAATAPDAAPPASLTAAELRVLVLLPTHLSFREIAEQTFISANTVKTQANAIYRKFDVCSRSEAVARARALGALD